MTDARSTTSRGSLSGLSQVIKDLTTLISSLAALLAACYALYNSLAAHEISVNAKKTANNTAATLAAQANATEQPAAAAAPAGSSPFTLQLATYQTKDCEAADQEIASYGGAFSPPPTLWRDPAGQYVIIGIATPDLGTAQTLQRVARKLSQQPSQAGNDLANAIIRRTPPWTALKSCQSI